MKLKINDFLPTDTSKKATEKLTKQVQLSSVAAAKEPKLRLGVLGIEIGQKQSTGDTSRVNESAAPLLEARSARGVLHLLQQLAHDVLDYEFGNLKHIDEASAVLGIYAYSLGEQRSDQLLSALLDVLDGAHTMVNYRKRDSERVGYNADKLLAEHGSSFPSNLKKALEAVLFLDEYAAISGQLDKTLDNASTVCQFLEDVGHMEFENDEDGFKRNMTAKVLKSLGVLQ